MVENALAVAVQPDGKLVVAGQTTQVDASTGKPVATLAVGRLLADGTPDTSFGSGGKVFVEGAGNTRLAHAGLVIQDDGKIDVACDSVVRLNPDGTLDSSWGAGGRAIFPLSFLGLDCKLQFDGKLIVLGTVTEGLPASWVYRLNADGTRDTSFHEGFSVGASGNTPLFGTFTELAVQADGQIAIAGNGDSGRHFALRLLHADGTPNPWNNTHSGIPFQTGDPNEYAKATSISIQADGRLLLAGEVNQNELGILRVNSDGSLDTSFDGDGKMRLSIHEGLHDDLVIQAVTALTDGKILVAGYDQFLAAEFGFVRGINLVLRLNSDGSLDPSFDGDGGVVFSFDPGAPSQLNNSSDPRFDAIGAMAVQGDGRIVVAGTWAPISDANTNGAFGLARLTAGVAPVVIRPTSPGDSGGGGDDGGPKARILPAFVGTSRVTTGKGRKKKVVGYQIRFNSPLDAAEAQKVTHFAVTQPGRGKHSTPKRIAVKSVLYSSLDDSVTLVLGKYDAKKPLTLTASGLVGVGGVAVATVLTRL